MPLLPTLARAFGASKVKRQKHGSTGVIGPIPVAWVLDIIVTFLDQIEIRVLNTGGHDALKLKKFQIYWNLFSCGLEQGVSHWFASSSTVPTQPNDGQGD